MAKPENKYKNGSTIWSIMEGDWEDLTVSEIADVLGASKNYVRTAMQKIKKETGYAVRCSGAKPEEPKETGGSENFSGRLRSMRKRRGLSGYTLGELCGLSKNMIQFYESGERNPRMASLVALADYFDVSIDYLVGRTNNPQGLL